MKALAFSVDIPLREVWPTLRGVRKHVQAVYVTRKSSRTLRVTVVGQATRGRKR